MCCRFTWTCCAAEGDIEHLLLLPLPPKGLDCRYIPPHLVYVVLEIDALALCVLGKYFMYIGVLPVCMFG